MPAIIFRMQRRTFALWMLSKRYVALTPSVFSESSKVVVYYLPIQTISNLRELLSFMSLSTYTLDHYNSVRKEKNIPRGLQSIGETRFATIYWSLESVLAGIDVFAEITRSRTLGIDSEVCYRLFQLRSQTLSDDILGPQEAVCR